LRSTTCVLARWGGDTPPCRWGPSATCIFGSRPLGSYVLTRLLSDGYFQAYRRVVVVRGRLCSLRTHLVTLPVGLGCFPLDRRSLATAVGLHVRPRPIRSLSGRRYPVTGPSTNSALPDLVSSTGPAKTGFVENQLSPSLISLSPLPTARPRLLQQSPVRSSIGCYSHFNLAMGSSLGFGSRGGDGRPSQSARFHCAFASSLKPGPLLRSR